MDYFIICTQAGDKLLTWTVSEELYDEITLRLYANEEPDCETSLSDDPE